MNRPLLVIALASFCCVAPVLGAAPAGEPAAAPSAQVPDRKSGDALAEAFLAWDAPVLAALTASPKARDQALAATSLFDGSVDGPALKRAAAQAPADALAQWLAAVHLDREDAATRDAAVRLTRLEPDNGAAWMLVYLQGDRDAESALVRAADAARFDDHYMDLLHAWLDAYARHQSAAAQVPMGPPWSDRFAAASAHAMEAATPAWNVFVDRCRDGSPGALDRRRACAELGGLMSRVGTSVASRFIGFAVLRAAQGGVLDAQDEAAQRQIAWYGLARSQLFDRNPGLEPETAAAIERDSLAAMDEVAFVRNSLRRAGMARQPPDDWTSPREAARAASADAAPASDSRPARTTSTDKPADTDPRLAAVRAALAESADPRDRVLAAASGSTGDDLALRRDARQADGDALVQWLAASHLGAQGDVSGAREAAARLTRLESDNGAAWMLAFALADEQGDADPTTLAQAAADASRFDDHSGDVARAWLDAWDRLAPDTAPIESGANYSAPFTAAGHASKPGIVYLSQACRRGQAKTGDLRAGCARLGSLMLQHGTSDLSRFLGAVVLQTLDGTASSTEPNYAMSDADRDALRITHWYRFGIPANTSPDQDAADLRAYPNWVAIAKHRLERAGLPPEPPADWKPAHRRAAPP